MTTRNSLTDPVLQSFLDELADYGTTPAPEPRPALVARLDGFTPLHAVPDPLATPEPRRTSARRRGLRPVAVAFVGGAVLFGGLASAGALPGPLQRVSADLGSHVGLDLPDPDADGSAPSTPVPTAGSRSDDPSRSEQDADGSARAGARASADSTPPEPAPTPTGGVAPGGGLPLPVPLPPVPSSLPADAPVDAPEGPARVTRREVRRILRQLSQLVPPP
jgi:hypothetical protein